MGMVDDFGVSSSVAEDDHPKQQQQLLLLLITIIIFVTLMKMIRNIYGNCRNRKRLLRLPPGSFGWPVVGETLEFLGSDSFVKERMEKYQSLVFKTSLTGNPVAVLCGAGGNKFLFGNENKLVQVWWPPSARKLLGNGLSNTVGEEAKQMRKMLSHFVGPDALMRLYIKTVDQVTRRHIHAHWRPRRGEAGMIIETFPVIKSYTFELACRLFMSLEDPHHIAKLAALFNVFLKGVISIPLNIPGTRFHSAARAAAAVREELLILLRQRRLALQHKTATPSQDLLSHLLSSPYNNDNEKIGKFMSESEIVNNVLLLLFAGHDTSSVTITLVIKILGELPQVYERVWKEQREIIASCSSSRRKGGGEDEDEYLLQWEDIQKMKYTWNVVCEVMRLWPPIMGTFREALVDFNYAGYDIPKGWKLYWSPATTHKDPEMFAESERFDPSRFEEGVGVGVEPYSYVPFGGGPRMCIGKEYARVEILVFLHNLVKDFSWTLVLPDEKILYDPMPTPVHGLPIRLLPHHLHHHPPPA